MRPGSTSGRSGGTGRLEPLPTPSLHRLAEADGAEHLASFARLDAHDPEDRHHVGPEFVVVPLPPGLGPALSRPTAP